MYNKDLVTVLMEHRQYAELKFRMDGEEIHLHDLEGKVEDNNETVTLNFKRRMK